MRTTRPPADRQFLQRTLDDAGAVGFVYLATGRDANLQYLTRMSLDPDVEYAFVFVDGQSILCSPPHAAPDEAFDGTARIDDDPAGVRAVAALDGLTREPGVVLTSRRIPHDAALHLEHAGYELASTRVLSDVRATKSPEERECVGRVQRAAVEGIRRAATVLADATLSSTDELVVGERTVTDERLRREVDAALVRAGVTDAENTSVVLGSAGSETRTDVWPVTAEGQVCPISRGETVTVVVAPRGSSGYHGACARTFVVDGDGGWERRASVAVDSAYDVAVGEIESGVALEHVREELLAELASFGFDPGDYRPENVCYSLGLSRRESFDQTEELRPGTILVIDPRVRDFREGLVRVGDPVVVTANGCEPLASSTLTRTLAPERYAEQ